MTTSPAFRIDPIPTDRDACITLMIDAMRDCANEIATSIPYLRADAPLPSRFDMNSDYDDYIPAAAACLHALAYAFHSHDHDSPNDAIAALLADDDFLLDAMTCDFSTPLFDLIHYADE